MQCAEWFLRTCFVHEQTLPATTVATKRSLDFLHCSVAMEGGTSGLYDTLMGLA